MLSLWSMIEFVTDLGDAAILLPLSFAILVLLVIFRDYRVAATWAFTIGSCAVVVVVLKIMFRSCGSVLTHDAIISPSGHTALSTTVYGALAGMIAARSQATRFRATWPLAAGILALSIGVSRIAVGAHKVGEVVLGLCVGTLFAALFWLVVHRITRVRVPILLIASVALVPVLALHGRHTNAEELFELLAEEFRSVTGLCIGDPPHLTADAASAWTRH